MEILIELKTFYFNDSYKFEEVLRFLNFKSQIHEILVILKNDLYGHSSVLQGIK